MIQSVERAAVILKELGSEGGRLGVTELSERLGLAKEVDARSVLSVMALGAREGSEVTVRATGRDAQAAVERLSAMLEVITPIEPAAPAQSEDSPAPALD